MPRQPNRRSYTKVLSALRKQELVRLCTEFDMPSEGSIPTLRDCLKIHINQNRNLFYQNPRYRALYATCRRHAPSPAAPCSPSLTVSYVLWNGIDQDYQPQPQPHPQVHPVQPQVQPQLLPAHPQVPSPQPSPSISNSERGSPLPPSQANYKRKSFLFLYSLGMKSPFLSIKSLLTIWV